MTQVTLHTDGNGLWSSCATAVNVVGMNTHIQWEDDEPDFGELRVYFDTKSWNVDKLGLIYTDCLFEKELNEFLASHGLPEASYSEQGMQGDDYVSLDVDETFCYAWLDKFGTDSKNTTNNYD